MAAEQDFATFQHCRQSDPCELCAHRARLAKNTGSRGKNPQYMDWQQSFLALHHPVDSRITWLMNPQDFQMEGLCFFSSPLLPVQIRRHIQGQHSLCHKSPRLHQHKRHDVASTLHSSLHTFMGAFIVSLCLHRYELLCGRTRN